MVGGPEGGEETRAGSFEATLGTGARVVLGGAAALAVLVLCYVVVSGRVVDLATAMRYMAPPAVAAVGLLLAQRLPTPARANVALAVLFTGVGAYLAEGVTRVVAASGAQECEGMDFLRAAQCRHALAEGLPFDTRSTLDVIRDLEAASPSVTAVPFMNPWFDYRVGADTLAPLGGISHTRTVYCAESGEYVIYDSDEHGFRNPGPWDDSSGGVVLVGDSFAQGFCVQDAESIAGRLWSSGRRVLNLGRDGSGPLAALAALKEYGLRASPSAVVWLFYEGNDLGDLEREKRFPMLGRYLDEGAYQQLVGRQSVVDSVLGDAVRARRAELETARAGPPGPLESVMGYLLLRRLRTTVAERLAAAPPPPPPPDRDLLRRVMSEARSAATAHGVELLFVYLPEYARYAPDIPFEDHRWVLDLVRELGIPTLEIEFERTLGDPLTAFPNRLPGHYGVDGYAVVAEEIRSWLDEIGAE